MCFTIFRSELTHWPTLACCAELAAVDKFLGIDAER